MERIKTRSIEGPGERADSQAIWKESRPDQLIKKGTGGRANLHPRQGEPRQDQQI